jgi:hypothetical protein
MLSEEGRMKTSTGLPSLFIAAGMRTGSTHIRNCFGRMGLRAANLHYYAVDGAYNEEQLIDDAAAQILLPMGGWVINQHMRAIGRNAHILKRHGIRPIVTKRNILDCLVSWVESHDSNISNGRGWHYTFSAIHCPTAWKDFTERDKYAWTVHYVAPWYVSHYISWEQADIETMIVNYATHYGDQVRGLRRIMDWLGGGIKELTDEQLHGVASYQDGRKSVGIAGRGKEKFPADMIRDLEKQFITWGPEYGPKLIKQLIEEE